MGSWSEIARRAASFAAETAAETLWPTRCAICDRPGSVLCERCAGELPYLDWWRACKRCGSAYGRVQCDTCNPVALARLGRTSLPFASCAGATMFSPEVGHVVRVFKDQGEQRLASAMASCMVRVLPPDWPVDSVTFVPATLSAAR
ncbi:MAG: ComF family protein, partial [Eggerthellaceae bacterium]|nr:ComF family protein [Eggerthellaceae bacterium]